MDLEVELIAALDDPSLVWEAVLNNLDAGSRQLLLVLSSNPTPLSMVHWQEAVVKVNPDAALRFEASLRILDDTFVSLGRTDHKHTVSFRNPSMDDFCSNFLDKNVGVAINIIKRNPTLAQVRRLSDLGAARRKGSRAFPRIYEALIKDPTLLLDRLFELMPADHKSHVDPQVPIEIVRILAETPVIDGALMKRVRERCGEFLASMTFYRHEHILYALLDNHRTAEVFSRIVGDDFESFYEALWTSAESPGNFDTLVNLCNALMIDPEEVEWADHFLERSDIWLTEATDLDDLDSSKSFYEQVSDFLGNHDNTRDDAWAEAQWQAQRDSEEDEPDDQSWRHGTATAGGGPDLDELLKADEDSQTLDEVDALFTSLSSDDRAEN